MQSMFVNLNALSTRGGYLALSVLVMTGAVACSSTATRFYTLSPVAAASAVTAPASGGAVIAIGPVTMPDYVDRLQIVVRTSANTVKQGSFDQWAGDLDDMVPRLLVENLSSRLPSDHFVSFPQVSDLAYDYRVPVSISRFDVSATGGAVVTARWQIRGKSGEGSIIIRETTAQANAAGGSYAELVAALSSAMGVLTDEIAATLGAQPRGSAGAATKTK